MDIELARTFLAISNLGTLARAAGRLNVTQATVSARLQTLEGLLGSRLFVRNKAGAVLTPTGHDFVPFATQLMQVWEQAQRKVAARAAGGILAVGGEFTLWSALLLNWLVELRTDRKDVVLRTHVDIPNRLLDAVQSGAVDIAVLYSPHRRPGTTSAQVLEEELIAVSTDVSCRALKRDTYVYVDWGPDFAVQHDGAFPELANPKTAVELGPLALRYLLRVGGSGYFRTRAVGPYLERGLLHRVPNTPPFSYSLHVVSSASSDPELIRWAQERLRVAADTPSEAWA